MHADGKNNAESATTLSKLVKNKCEMHKQCAMQQRCVWRGIMRLAQN